MRVDLHAASIIIALMMEAAHISETSVDNYFTCQCIPEDKSELYLAVRDFGPILSQRTQHHIYQTSLVDEKPKCAQIYRWTHTLNIQPAKLRSHETLLGTCKQMFHNDTAVLSPLSEKATRLAS
jgi:hypothetical protein